MRQPSVSHNTKLALNLNVVLAIGGRTSRQAKLRSNQWTTLGVNRLEKTVWVLLRRQIETNVLVCRSVAGGNHAPNANGCKLPRLVSFERGKPHVERVDAALQFS